MEITFKEFVLGTINKTIKVGTKIEWHVPDSEYKYNIHGEYYRWVYEFRRGEGICYEVFNKEGREANYGWWNFSLPLDEKTQYTILDSK